MEFDTGADKGENQGEESESEGSGENRRGGYNLSDPVGSFVATVRSIVLEPASFFRGMQRSGDYVTPLVFTLICAAIGGILSGLITLISGLVAGDTTAAISGLLSGIFLNPIFAVIGLFIAAGITHLFVMLFVRPQNTGFEATYRVIAYLSVLYLVSWLTVVPILGFILLLALLVYLVVLEVIGIREAHSTTTGRASVTVLIPTGIAIVLISIIVVIVAVIAVSVQQGQF